MKIQKKLFVFAVLLMAASLVFAQTSMTSHSTQELFGTDVDDFMNVNEWQNVQPKNIFGFLGYGKTGKGSINLGLAHQFKAFYLGTYFEGQVNSWISKKETSGNTETSTSTQHKSNGKLLFGFGNIGVMTDMSYQPKANNKVTWTEATKTKQTDNLFKLDFNLIAGMNLNLNNKLFKISAKLGLESDIDKKTTKKDSKLTKFTDGSKYDLVINAGLSHDLSSKDGLTHTVLADLDTRWGIWPTKRDEEVLGGVTTTNYKYGELKDIITLTPKYQIAYEPEGKFAFKAEAALGIGFDFDNEYNYTRRVVSSGGDTKAYNIARKYKTTLSLKPALKTAFTYAPVSKFKLNFGLGFNVPSNNWVFNKTETRDIGNGNVTKTDKDNTFTFNTNDGKFTASSGFTWLITENVTFDANWDIVDHLLKTFSTDLTEGDGKNFWETVNKLVVHNIKFALSVKF
ncbi:hypothetical protein E4N87_11535 [Treponema denticola]|uniref:Major outer sheath protein n=1 Tax=Treponema denticola TaxID=158 RepID=A0A9Q9BHY6_TREDN|nr:hypothetical protein [Treponema denticola]UTC91280.1 hypothetical protein E4N87_11535 [Treponema denticola]UTC99366.1 hypothetical protein E4N86_01040 [Treponema denticola]